MVRTRNFLRGVLLVAITLSLFACGGGWEENPDQYRFSNSFSDDSTTDAQLDQLCAASHKALDWNALVENVYEDGELTVVDARYNSQSYKLKLFDADAKNKAMSLKKGSHLLFSGNIGVEQSLTRSGARSNPEFEFYPSSIVSGDMQVIQEPGQIEARVHQDELRVAAARQRLEQAAEDSSTEDQVVQLCKNTVLENLSYPASGSFSWFKKEVEKISAKKWVYRDVVSAKNSLGAELPSRFVCTVTINGENMTARVKILG